MASVMDVVSEGIRETIDQGIGDMLPKLDPVMKNIIRTSTGVARSSIGRDWEVRHTYCGSISGAHYFRAAAGPDVSVGASTNSNLTVFNTGQGWQGLDEMSGPGLLQRTIQLKQGIGNFPVPLHILQSDRLDASVGPVISKLVQGAARRHSLSDVHCFWKLEATGNAIARITADGSGTDITTTPQEFTLADGRIRMFYPGLFVDLFGDTGGASTTAGVDVTDNLNNTSTSVVVRSVDYVNQKIKLRTVSGTAALAANETVWIVPGSKGSDRTAGTVANAPGGLVDFIKSTGNLYGTSIALSSFPEWGSIVDTSLSGALESDILNKYVAGFMDAYGVDLDTLLMTTGVMTGFLENINSTQQLIEYNLQGEALDITAGFHPLGYMFDGRVFKLATSPNCHRGTCWGVKLNEQNWKKYVPPRLPRSRADGRFAGEVEFVSPAMGFNSIFQPLHNSSDASVTNIMQAPYQNFCEYAFDDPRGIRLGIFEENIYEG